MQIKRESKLFKYSLPIYALLSLILLDSIIAPLLESKMIQASFYFYLPLCFICHQLPTRCLWIFGSNMALCSRCFGIYSGIVLIGIFFNLRWINKFSWKFAFIFMLPAIVDGITQYMGLRMSNNLIRFGSGLLFGIGIGMVLYTLYFLIISALLNIRERHKAITFL